MTYLNDNFKSAIALHHLQLEYELRGCDLHGLKVEFTADGDVKIDLPHAVVYVEKRPGYCDRGRYGFWVDVKEEHHDKINVDFADRFPRYFFSLQRALDEMNDWIQFNKERLGTQPTPAATGNSQRLQ